MYGLLLDSIQKLLREKYGERYWANIRRRAKLKNHWFVTHEVYSDSMMHDLVQAAALELGEETNTVMMMFGEYFVETIGRYGYARLLRVLGRDMRDFLNGLDDLHEYLRFSYPKMRPPSFQCENETPSGMLLHYTTKRRGYLCYVIGQLKTVAKIYDKEVEITVKSENSTEKETHIVLDLHFDNREVLFQRHKQASSMAGMNFQVDSDTFLSIFPFCIIFKEDLLIQRVGSKMMEVLPSIMGQNLADSFVLHKPQFGELTWKTICNHTHCMFELVSVDPVIRAIQPSHHHSSPGMDYSARPPQLSLKGQMMVLSNLSSIVFLCSPAVDSPEDLYQNGIFISDLPMHDSSRNFALAGSQLNPELNLALNQEQIRTTQLEESIQQTDELLYQLIPQPIADQLRKGETPLNTCQEFSSVSLLFTDIVSFTSMCSRLRPMEVVCVLNAMYVAFDKLCEKHHVYKVENIGDAYMVISGAPISTPHHAEYITDFAFSSIEATSKINDPSTQKSLRIRVGIHSGTVVAGVVGVSVLRYDVFGDTVNVAARMEATGEPMRIHISEATADLLQATNFIVEERGRAEVKGKGLMTTYWVTGKRSSDNSVSEETLNPFQRSRQPLEQLRPASSPPSPTCKDSQNFLLTPTRRPLRASSPGPDEWLQTEMRLSQNKREGGRPRSSSTPTSFPPLQSISPTHKNLVLTPVTRTFPPKPHEWPQAERRLSQNKQERGHQHNSTISVVGVESLGNQHGSIFPIQVPTTSQRAEAATNLWSRSNVNSDQPLLNPVWSMPEFNIFHVRSNVSAVLPTIAEDSTSHTAVNLRQQEMLASLTALADENTRLAQRLTDLAAELARVTVRSKEESLECSDPSFPPEGTSVDPQALRENVETVTTVQEHSSVEECREHGSTCGVM